MRHPRVFIAVGLASASFVDKNSPLNLWRLTGSIDAINYC